jgi:adenosylmethionine-8-amino-7-oxononanoate aminotransferase
MTDVSVTPIPAVGGSQDVFYRRDALVPLPVIDRASGIRMWDTDGNEYIDASSGPMVSALGHCNPCVLAAMAEQAGRLDYAYTRVARNGPNLEYAQRLCALTGPGFERVFLTSGGSEAVDAAVKFLRCHAVAAGQQSRRRVITLEPSYHGATIAATAMTGDRALETLLDGFALASDKVPAPLSYRLPEGETVESYAERCAEALEAAIASAGSENVLAFVLEPVGGLSTGAVVPPPSYFTRIREICSRHGVRLVFDEILCGSGRSGRFVTAHHWPDSMPDLVVVAKGLGAGYSPLGAVLAPASLVDELATLGGFESSYSYNANPISCAVGLAVLEEIERLDLVRRAEVAGSLLRHGLEEIAETSPIVGDVRGMGLLLAVELVADKETKAPLPPTTLPTERIRIHGLRNGVMLYSRETSGGRYGHWFMVAPPLTITDAEIGELLQRTEASVGDLYRELCAEGVV